MPSPSVRYSSALAYDSARQKIILVGGTGPGGHLGDTWELDLNGWVEKSSEFPGVNPSYGPGHIAYFPNLNRTFYTHGGGGMSKYDGTSWEAVPHQGDPWPAPVGALSAFHTGLNKLVYVGGVYLNGFGSGRTHTFDGTTWVCESFSVPPCECMAYDPIRDKFVAFGSNGQTWEMSPDDWTWERVFPQSSPRGRFGVSMVFSPVTGTILMFGGQVAEPNENDPPVPDGNGFDSYNGTTWSDISIEGDWPSPPELEESVGRRYTSLAQYGNDTLVLFGGTHEPSSGPFNDTWAFKDEAWTLWPPPEEEPTAIAVSVAPPVVLNSVATPVVIAGVNLNQATAVALVGVAGTTNLTPFTIQSPTHIQVTIPQNQAESAYKIRITSANGVLLSTSEILAVLAPMAAIPSTEDLVISVPLVEAADGSRTDFHTSEAFEAGTAAAFKNMVKMLATQSTSPANGFRELNSTTVRFNQAPAAGSFLFVVARKPGKGAHLVLNDPKTLGSDKVYQASNEFKSSKAFFFRNGNHLHWSQVVVQGSKSVYIPGASAGDLIDSAYEKALT